MNSIKIEDTNIQILPTGNPFIDSSIIAVSIIKNINSINITIKDLYEAIKSYDTDSRFGYAFTKRNYRTKGLYMVYFNNPLMQNALNKKKSKDKPWLVAEGDDQPSPIQQRLYRTFLVEFFVDFVSTYAISNESIHACVACGQGTTLDFNYLENELNNLLPGNEDKESRKFGSGPTRGWFPLIGSIGSEAQSLPAFTEPHFICSKCIILVTFLPQITDIYQGKLALYQSNNSEITRAFIENNLNEFTSSNDLTRSGTKLEIVGKNEGNERHIIGLLETVTKFYDEDKNNNLTIWFFSNSGTSPDCDFIEFPDPILKLLREIYLDTGIKNVLVTYIKNEKKWLKHPSRFFMNCLQSGKDYDLFYSHSKSKMITPRKLYDYYQYKIRYWSPDALNLVVLISEQIKQTVEKDTINRIIAENKLFNLRHLIQPIMLKLLDEDKCNIRQVMELFASSYASIEKRNPLKLFFYYLHSEVDTKNDFSFESNDITSDYEPDVLKLIQIIRQLANWYRTNRSTKSSFVIEKHLDIVSRFKIQDILGIYVSYSKFNHNYNWNTWNDVNSKIKNQDIMLYFRIFTHYTDDVDLLEEITEVPLTLDSIIDNSGLHPVVVTSIFGYIDELSRRNQLSRVIDNIRNDIRNGNYTEDSLLQTINDKFIELNHKDQIIKDFQWYGFEINITGNFSWYIMRNKIIMIINQYSQLKSMKVEKIEVEK